MNLKERVLDIRRRFNVSVSPSVLRSYYLRQKVSFRTVDLHVVKKARMKNLLAEQQTFVRKIRRARAVNRAIFFIDESSVSLWSPLRRRTWTNGEVTLPMQPTRGPNRTIYGAIGGVEDLYFRFSIANSTN